MDASQHSKELLRLRSIATASTLESMKLEEKETAEIVERTKEQMSFLRIHIENGTQWHKKMLADKKKEFIEDLRLWRTTIEREVKQVSDCVSQLNKLISSVDHKKLNELSAAISQIQALSNSPVYSAILKAVEIKS